jgi:hypothetical protein
MECGKSLKTLRRACNIHGEIRTELLSNTSLELYRTEQPVRIVCKIIDYFKARVVWDCGLGLQSFTFPT